MRTIELCICSCFLLALSGMVACSPDWSGNRIQTPAQTLQRIAADTLLPIPSGSRFLAFEEAVIAFDVHHGAKVVIPATAYAGFERAVSAKTPIEMGFSGSLAEDVDWWEPGNVVLEKAYGNNPYIRVIASDEGEVYEIYIDYGTV